MILLTIGQNIYIVLALIGILIVGLLCFILIYRNVYTKKHFDVTIYKKLYRTSVLNDYLLLNNYKLQVSEKTTLALNHVLITNKFIVLINDFYIKGAITGNYNDEQLIKYSKKGEEMILNPLTYNRNIMKRIALLNDLDNSFLKGIVVIADDSVIDVKDIPSQFYFCTKKELPEIIKKIDSTDVKPFKAETVERFIAKLDSINIKE